MTRERRARFQFLATLALGSLFADLSAPFTSVVFAQTRTTQPSRSSSYEDLFRPKNYPYCIQREENRSHDRGVTWKTQDDLDRILDYNREQYLRDLNAPKYCESSDLKWIQSHFRNHPADHDILVLSTESDDVHHLSRNGTLIETLNSRLIHSKRDPNAAIYRVTSQSKTGKRLVISDEQSKRSFKIELQTNSKPGDLKHAIVIVSNPNQSAWADINGKLVQRPLSACYVGDDVPLPVKYVNHDPESDSELTRRFLKTLSAFKPKLMSMYHLTNHEYDSLARMAFGILGNETEFGESFKYQVKENPLTSWIVPVLKSLKGKGDARSRGLIQMKNIPESLRRTYPELEGHSELLTRPDYAALAAMSYLSETLDELRRRKATFNAKAPERYRMNAWNEYDYLPYLYMGKNAAIRDGTATPDKNLYVQSLKRIMAKITVERL